MRRFPPSASLALTGATAFLIACSGSDLTLPDQGLAAKLVIVRGDPQTASAGSQLADSLVVRVTDSKDRPVQGQLVGFAAGAGTVVPATTATNADGRAGAVWVLGPAAGPQTATATVNGNGAPSGLVVTFHATATSATPARLEKTAGDGQQATAGSPVSAPPAVKVTDVGGNPVAGVAVTFAVTVGGGSVNPTTPVITDAAGVATASSWVLGPLAGPNTLTATIPGAGVTGNPAAFSATGVVGSAGRLAIARQPSAAAQSGVPFTQQPQVQVQDSRGNPVSTAGIAVEVTLASGVGAGLSGQLTVPTDANGVAAFTNLMLTGPQGGYTLAFSNPTLAGVTSAAIQLGPGAPSQLVIAQQPAAAAQSGVPLNPQPAVQLEDAQGNPVPQAGVAVTAVLNGAGATLSGTKTQLTDATGKAAFTDLVITGTSGQYSLSFGSASPLLAVGPSGTIGLGAGTAAKLVLVTPPSASVASGQVFPQQPVIQALDGAGNPVAAAGITVRAAITAGGGTLGGTPTAVTDAAGIAAFTGLSITGTVGTRQLTFSSTSPSLTPATASVAVTAGPATQIAASSPVSQVAAAGTAVAAPPSVLVRDASLNPVPGVAVTFAVAAGGGTVSPATPVATNASGVASLTSWTLGPVAGANQVTATATGLSGSPVTFNATGVSALAITAASPLPPGEVNASYSTPIAVSGGSPPYTWSVSAGSLPGGLSLAAATGAISGKPTTAGTPPGFTIQVTDAAKTTVAKAFTVTILPAVTLATASLPNGAVGAPYSQAVAITGGQAPFAWSVASGALPPGLSLGAATGIISGTPTAAGGPFGFTIRVTDALGGSDARTYAITIASAPTISTTSLPAGEAGVAYAGTTLTATGGQTPYGWSVQSGSLDGLTLNPTTGAISGTPSAAGTFSVTFLVTDANSATATRTLSLVVRAAVAITTTSLPNGSVGSAYSQTVAVSGGQTPYAWSVSSGALPPGLSLAPGTGVISGTPTTAGGPFGFTISVTDALGGAAARAYSITIAAASTTTTVTSSDASSVFGESVTFRATVSSGAGTPDGTVTFKDGGTCGGGGTVLDTQTLAGGIATSVGISSLSVATHSILACYAGGAGFAGSSGTVSQVVAKAATTTQITSDLSVATSSSTPLTVAFSVSVTAPGAGAPTGTVTVQLDKKGGNGSCSAPVSAGSCTIPAPIKAGARTVKATYGGDTSFSGSSSPQVPHTVTP